MLTFSELQEITLKIKDMADNEILSLLLGVTSLATFEEIEVVRRKKMLLYHPDKYTSSEEKELAAGIFTRLCNAIDAKKNSSGSNDEVPDFVSDWLSRQRRIDAEYMKKIKSFDEPMRTQFLDNIFWVHSLRDAGIYLDELAQIPNYIRCKLLTGVGSQNIIDLKKIGISLSQVMAIQPVDTMNYLLDHGMSVATFIERTKIPLSVIQTIKKSILTELLRIPKSTAYLIEKGITLNEIISLDLQTIKSFRNSMEYSNTLDSLSTPSFRIIDLFKVNSLAVRNELLSNLFDVLELVGELQIPLADLINISTSERELLFDKIYRLKDLINDGKVPWDEIKALESSIRTEIIQYGSFYARYISESNLSLAEIVALSPETRNHLVKDFGGYFMCLGPDRMSLTEVLNLDPTVRKQLFQDIDSAEKIIDKMPWSDAKHEMYLRHFSYFLAPLKEKVQNVVDLLPTLNQTQRDKLYANWSLVEKLVNQGQVPCDQLSIVVSMDDAIIKLLEKTVCLQALSNQSINIAQLAAMSVEELERATTSGDFSPAYQSFTLLNKFTALHEFMPQFINELKMLKNPHYSQLNQDRINQTIEDMESLKNKIDQHTAPYSHYDKSTKEALLMEICDKLIITVQENLLPTNQEPDLRGWGERFLNFLLACIGGYQSEATKNREAEKENIRSTGESIKSRLNEIKNHEESDASIEDTNLEP